MTDIVLSICLSLVTLGILFFFINREKHQSDYVSSIQALLTELPKSMQEFYSKLEADKDTKREKFLKEVFDGYLQHIKELEKMSLPQPVRQQDVEAILRRGPELAENDIDKPDNIDGIELNETNFKNIPFNTDTNIIFEDEIPTTIE